MAAQTNRQVTATDSDGATLTIDVTFDDVTIRVGLITWNNTSTRRKAFVVLSQPGKPTISRVVAAAGVAPAQGEVAASGSVNVPPSGGGYTYDPTGDDAAAAQLSSQWI